MIIMKISSGLVSGILSIKLIFFLHPGPKGSEENQFTPLGDGVNKLIFKRFNRLWWWLPI